MADLEASKLKPSEFQINFTDGIQFLMWLAGFQVILEHKEKAKPHFNFLWRCEMPDHYNCVFICMFVCICVHKNTFLYISNKYDAKINKEKK